MIDATPETVRGTGQALQLAALLDDRMGHADDAKIKAWAEQIQRHRLTRTDLLDAVQAFYDEPHDHAIAVGDLIQHGRAIRRARLEKEADDERDQRREAFDTKAAADDFHAIVAGISSPASAATPAAKTSPGSLANRFINAELALQTCHGKQESKAAVLEFFAAKAALTSAGEKLPGREHDWTAQQRVAHYWENLERSRR